MNQTSLFAAHGSREKRPTAGIALVERLLEVLAGSGWMSSDALAHELGVDKRTLREAAHESGGRVISGQAGYHATVEASIQDVDAFVGRMYSQAREMRERAMQVERVKHGRAA